MYVDIRRRFLPKCRASSRVKADLLHSNIFFHLLLLNSLETNWRTSDLLLPFWRHTRWTLHPPRMHLSPTAHKARQACTTGALHNKLQSNSTLQHVRVGITVNFAWWLQTQDAVQTQKHLIRHKWWGWNQHLHIGVYHTHNWFAEKWAGGLLDDHQHLKEINLRTVFRLQNKLNMAPDTLRHRCTSLTLTAGGCSQCERCAKTAKGIKT